ncbi:MAG: NAD(P)-dependent oxidoreductase [Acidimicrobiales bacterium]
MPETKVTLALPLALPLLAELGDFEITYLPAGRADDTAFALALTEAEGLLVNSNVIVDAGVIASAPNLRVISTMSVGLDHIDMAAVRERGITVTIAAVLNDAVADLTMAFMIMLARRIPEGMNVVHDGGWAMPLGYDIAGKTLLLIGFGRIGQTVAERALASKMIVTYYDARGAVPEFPGVTPVDDLREGLASADFVSMHVDLNAGTKGMIGSSELAAMRPTAYLINTSRGGVVDQDALAKALNDGVIAGAALDVLRDEPPLRDDPILFAPNVIIVPHIGSATVETRDAMARCAVDNLIKVLRGEETPFKIS